MRNLPLLRRRRVFLCAGLAVMLTSIAPHDLGHAQEDLLTPEVQFLLADQWRDEAGARACIRALEDYGNGRSDAALKDLENVPLLGEQDRQTYQMAADVLGPEFWRLLAASHADPPEDPPIVSDCSAASDFIRAQFITRRWSLYETSKQYHAKGPYTALAVLLTGQFPDPDTADARHGRLTYRGCFDLDPKLLFDAVDKTLGVRH